MSERKVLVESMVPFAFSLNEPYSRFTRIFNREGQKAKIDFEIMEEGLSQIGFRDCFMSGNLKIVEKKDRVDLGLEAAEGDEGLDYFEEIITLNTNEIVKLLKAVDKTELDNTLAKCSPDLVKRFVQIAIQFKITDGLTVDTLRKYHTGPAIENLIKLKADKDKPVVEDNE